MRGRCQQNGRPERYNAACASFLPRRAGIGIPLSFLVADPPSLASAILTSNSPWQIVISFLNRQIRPPTLLPPSRSGKRNFPGLACPTLAGKDDIFLIPK